MTRRPFQVLVLIGLTSCSLLRSFNPEGIGNATRATAAHHIDLAEAELASGNYERGLERLVSVRAIQGLDPEDRARAEEVLGQGVDRALDQYSGAGFSPDDLLAFYRLDLPSRLKARAGVRAAARMLEEGERVRAAKMIRKVEKDLPSHAERALAGDVLARAGLSLANDDGRYYLLFHYRARGVEALEFLVLTYPFDPHVAEAYFTLARIYERQSDFDKAIARYEDLLVYHATSPYAVTAQARLPLVRMKRLERDDYDRGELQRAETELVSWLERHAGHELTPWVEKRLKECRARLASSDLILARYYRRVGQPFGTRVHAQRALAEASAAGAEGQASEARSLLQGLPPEEVLSP